LVNSNGSKDGNVSKNDVAQTGYAAVNGMKLYYENHPCDGQGAETPLILLHGGLCSTDDFNEILPPIVGKRRVIAMDMQGHGRTADIDRPMRVETMADDVAALMKHLAIEKADLLGYSLGGSVALRVAIQHPNLVRKFIVISAPFGSEGWYPEIGAALAQMMNAESAEALKQSPPYEVYARVAPRPEDWPVFIGKLGDLVRQTYDWSTEVSAIKAPTMLVFGDADSVSPAHAAQFFGLLGGGKKDGGWDGSGIPNSRLAIVPGMTHYNMLSSPLLMPAVVAFLDAPMPASK
jgi:pimeloyl-ACP methyl ester carboxylesterase